MISERVWEILADSFLKILIPGLTMTIPLTAISFTLALLIAVVVALVQFADIRVLKQIARFYVWVVRGTPLLVQLFIVFYGLPGIGLVLDPFPAAVIVFSLNEGAYAAETIRAALEAVPRGRLKRDTAWACPTCRSCGALCCHRHFEQHSRRCRIR